MSEQNKAIARRVVDRVWNEGNLDAADELFAPDFVGHMAGRPDFQGAEDIKAFVSSFRAAFPDLRMTIEDQVAEGDRVVNRFTATGTHQGEFMGIAPTGKRATAAGLNVQRVAGGRIAEGWGFFDVAGLLEQLGAGPARQA